MKLILLGETYEVETVVDSDATHDALSRLRRYATRLVRVDAP